MSEKADLLSDGDCASVTRAQLSLLVSMCGTYDVDCPDWAEVKSLHYAERLSGQGTEGHLLGGGVLERGEKGVLSHAEFRRRLKNTLPMLWEASIKRRHELYLTLAKQRAARAQNRIRCFMRGKLKGDPGLLTEALDVLDAVKNF